MSTPHCREFLGGARGECTNAPAARDARLGRPYCAQHLAARGLDSEGKPPKK